MNEDALKDRLRVVAKDKAISFNEAWKQLLLERFLARLSRSIHCEKFIFKGGLLLSQLIPIGRETTDADFLMTKIKNTTSAIEEALRVVASVQISDGFNFEWSRIEVLAQPHMEYPGFQAHFNSKFGKMKDKIHVDIGVGDLVEPIKDNFHPFEYKGKPLFEGEITLLTYPIETIFAEKLETIISKGATNSRMKDYHDVILILRETGLINPKALEKTLTATFKHRQTNLQLPIKFDESGIQAMQRLWSNHLSGLGSFRQKLKLPESIEVVINEINEWMLRINSRKLPRSQLTRS